MFGIRPPFSTSTLHSEKIVKLLNSVTLGSNGARYRHQGINERIKQLFHPLFVNLSIRDRLVSNVTFCRRSKDWYVRYFAFDQVFQSNTNNTTKTSRKSKLKEELNTFFQNALDDNEGPEQFYAYIDPKNERSLMMSETFGFKPAATVVTQTFSRLKPKKGSVKQLKDQDEIERLVRENFSDRPFFHPYQTYNETPFYVLEKKGEIVAFAKSHRAAWTIERLPGLGGNTLTKIIPYIPVLNKIIKPKSHQFTVIDSVWVKDHNKNYFEELAEGILACEENNVIHWWVDKKEELWSSIYNSVNWGILDRLNRTHDVHFMIRSNRIVTLEKPAYVSGFDFI